MDATPSPEYTYILVILLGIAFVLGLAAGYLSKTRQPTLPEDLKQQFYNDGYLAGFNAGNGDAFKKGYGQRLQPGCDRLTGNTHAAAAAHHGPAADAGSSTSVGSDRERSATAALPHGHPLTATVIHAVHAFEKPPTFRSRPFSVDLHS